MHYEIYALLLYALWACQLYVELPKLVGKGKGYITFICNSHADSRYSSVEVCKQSTLMGWKKSKIQNLARASATQGILKRSWSYECFSKKIPYFSFTCYQLKHLMSILQFSALNPVCCGIHYHHVCATTTRLTSGDVVSLDCKRNEKGENGVNGH